MSVQFGANLALTTSTRGIYGLKDARRIPTKLLPQVEFDADGKKIRCDFAYVSVKNNDFTGKATLVCAWDGRLSTRVDTEGEVVVSPDGSIRFLSDQDLKEYKLNLKA